MCTGDEIQRRRDAEAERAPARADREQADDAACGVADAKARPGLASRQGGPRRSRPGTGGAHAWPQYYTDGCLPTRKRRMVTAPDRVLSSGSRSILARPREENRMPSPSSTGMTYTRISSTNPRCRH